MTRLSRVILGLLVAAAVTGLIAQPANAALAKSGAHWLQRSGPVTVFVVDQTAGSYPVQEAMNVWNTSPHVHLVLASRCPAHRGCVYIRLKDYIDGYDGYTDRYYRHKIIYLCVISLLPPKDFTPEYALVVVMHELGHSLGLGHSPNPSSVMNEYSTDGALPDEQDFADLAYLYP